MNRLQKKCQSLEAENSSVQEQLGGLIDSVETLTSERDTLKDQKDHAETEMIKKLEVCVCVWLVLFLKLVLNDMRRIII